MARRGPKEKITEPERLRQFMRLKPTLEDTAAFFQVSTDTVERFIKKTWGLKYAEFRRQNMVDTRMSLVRKALEKAHKGDNVMLIFCLKNLCGWKDRHEVRNKGSTPPGGSNVPQVIVTIPSNNREAKLQ